MTKKKELPWRVIHVKNSRDMGPAYENALNELEAEGRRIQIESQPNGSRLIVGYKGPPEPEETAATMPNPIQVLFEHLTGGAPPVQDPMTRETRNWISALCDAIAAHDHAGIMKGLPAALAKQTRGMPAALMKEIADQVEKHTELVEKHHASHCNAPGCPSLQRIEAFTLIKNFLRQQVQAHVS